MTMRRIIRIALTWGCLWLLFAALLFLALAILDPDSIDDGEVEGAIFILGPMGILTGFAFAFLILIGSEITKGSDLSLIRAISWGFVGSAIVQVFYLGSWGRRPGRQHRYGSYVLGIRRPHLGHLACPGAALGLLTLIDSLRRS